MYQILVSQKLSMKIILLYSKGYYKNYNTNITEKVLINNFEFDSSPKFLNNGVVNKKKF